MSFLTCIFNSLQIRYDFPQKSLSNTTFVTLIVLKRVVYIGIYKKYRFLSIFVKWSVLSKQIFIDYVYYVLFYMIVFSFYFAKMYLKKNNFLICTKNTVFHT